MSLLKNDFISLIDEIDKLDIPKLFNVPTNLENLKTKVDNLGVDELKNEQEHAWKKITDIVDNEAVKH